MNFASALFSMQRGHKVKRSHWGGYWFIKDGEVIIHTREGEELNIRDTKDMMYTLSNIACDDWEIADKYPSDKDKYTITKEELQTIVDCFFSVLKYKNYDTKYATSISSPRIPYNESFNSASFSSVLNEEKYVKDKEPIEKVIDAMLDTSGLPPELLKSPFEAIKEIVDNKFKKD